MAAHLTKPDEDLQHLHVPGGDDAQSIELIKLGLRRLIDHVVELSLLGTHLQHLDLGVLLWQLDDAVAVVVLGVLGPS